MTAERLPKISVKLAVTLIIFGVTLLIALPLNWFWWRTARASSLQLIDALSSQVAATAQRDFWSGVTAAETAFGLADLLIRPGAGSDDIVSAISAGLTTSETLSAIAFDAPAVGRFTVTRDAAGNLVVQERMQSMPFDGLNKTSWFGPVADPASGGRAVAYAGQARAMGSLSVFIGLDRFTALLASLPVGQSGIALVVDAKGATPIRPRKDMAGELEPVISAVGTLIAARPPDAVNIVDKQRIESAGAGYRVFLSPLNFRAWQLVVIVPEAEYLGPIDQMVQRALMSLVTLALILGLLASFLAQRILSRPLSALVRDIERVQVFDLEAVSHRRLALKEFDELSGALSRMAKGLADFGKFIPTDLVRTLLTDGKRATPGGEARQVTVMFADAAGFTRLSERVGVAVVDIISRYLDVASRTVEAHGGIVDKYIGDAVMALWGAPGDDDNQALNACRAALEIVRAVKESGVVDDRGEPLGIRIGLSAGLAVVGNIGSPRRLNYTAIGDTVNLASRLEGANKAFGTAILISEATRQMAGDEILTREIGTIAVFGGQAACGSSSFSTDHRARIDRRGFCAMKRRSRPSAADASARRSNAWRRCWTCDLPTVRRVGSRRRASAPSVAAGGELGRRADAG